MKKDLNDKMLFGVCSGLAHSLNMDPTVVRLIFGVGALLGFGLPILVYLVLAIVMPVE